MIKVAIPEITIISPMIKYPLDTAAPAAAAWAALAASSPNSSFA
ncbi:hypothetical protein [Algoriphagus boritolerans]